MIPNPKQIGKNLRTIKEIHNNTFLTPNSNYKVPNNPLMSRVIEHQMFLKKGSNKDQEHR
jgi:hypothetical protein